MKKELLAIPLLAISMSGCDTAPQGTEIPAGAITADLGELAQRTIVPLSVRDVAGAVVRLHIDAQGQGLRGVADGNAIRYTLHRDDANPDQQHYVTTGNTLPGLASGVFASTCGAVAAGTGAEGGAVQAVTDIGHRDASLVDLAWLKTAADIPGPVAEVAITNGKLPPRGSVVWVVSRPTPESQVPVAANANVAHSIAGLLFAGTDKKGSAYYIMTDKQLEGQRQTSADIEPGSGVFMADGSLAAVIGGSANDNGRMSAAQLSATTGTSVVRNHRVVPGDTQLPVVVGSPIDKAALQANEARNIKLDNPC